MGELRTITMNDWKSYVSILSKGILANVLCIALLSCSSSDDKPAKPSGSSSSGTVQVEANPFDFSVAQTINIEENRSSFTLSPALSGTFSGSITYGIIEQGDYGSFQINSNTGEASFISAPNYELPGDQDEDNVYLLTLSVTTSEGQSDSAMTRVVVVNVDESPYLSSSSEYVVPEDQSEVGVIEVLGGDDSPSWKVGDEEDSFNFIKTEDGQLAFAQIPDYEDPKDVDENNEYQLEIEIFDGSSYEGSETITIVVEDELEGINTPTISPIAMISEKSTGYRMIANSSMEGSLPIAISGVGDADLFEVDPETQVLQFKEPLNSDQDDANGDGVFDISLRAKTKEDNVWEKTFQLTPVSKSALRIDIVVPGQNTTPIKTFEYENYLTFSGYVRGVQSSPLAQNDVANFSVNGAPIEIDLETGRWSAEVNLGAGESAFQFLLEDSKGNIASEVRYIQRNSYVNLLTDGGIAFDSDTNQVVVSDGAGPIAINLENRNVQRFDISRQFQDFVLDESTSQMYGVTQTSLWRLDTATYEAELLSDFTDESIGVSDELTSITLDEKRGFLYLLAYERNAQPIVYKYALNSGVVEAVNFGEDAPTIFLPKQIAFNPSDETLTISDGDGYISFDPLLLNVQPIILKFPENVLNPDYISGLFIDTVNSILWGTTEDSGSNHIFSVELGTGAADWVTGIGPELFEPTDITGDLANNRLIVVDARRDMILEINPGSGDLKTLFGSNIGDGPYLWRPTDLALDTVNQKAYIFTILGTLIEIDLQSSNRRVVSGRSEFEQDYVGDGISFSIYESAEVDTLNNRLFVADTGRDSVLSVDLATGDRSILSTGSSLHGPVGTGADIPALVDIVFDSESQTMYGIDLTADVLIEIDVTSGDRTIISGVGTGAGDMFVDPMGLEMDFQTKTAYVFDYSLEQIFVVDIASGDRSILEVDGKFPTLPDVKYQYFDQVDLELDVQAGVLYISYGESYQKTIVDIATGELFTPGSDWFYGESTTGFEMDFERGVAYGIFYGEQHLRMVDTITHQEFVVSQ